MERSDKERLNFMEEIRNVSWFLDEQEVIRWRVQGQKEHYPTLREALDAAMSASEAGELEAAKTMFWERKWALWTPSSGTWNVGRQHTPYWSAASVNEALVYAYRASKGK